MKKYSQPRPHIPNAIQQQVRIEARFACVICKNEAITEIAHIDDDRTNNDPSNLVLLCRNHHGLYDSGKIKRTEIKKLKKIAQEENDVLSQLKQQLEYIQNSPQISASAGFLKIKRKYQDLLNDFGDKLIFYQCFIYLIPGFYIDDRGQKTREIVRDFLTMDSGEEQLVLTHLQKLGIIEVTGGLISLKDNADAKTATTELLEKGKINLSELLMKFGEL